MIERIRTIGWLAVELAFVLVALCVLLNLLLGASGGSFINEVAQNTEKFLQAVPPGALLGVVLIFALYALVRKRFG